MEQNGVQTQTHAYTDTWIMQRFSPIFSSKSFVVLTFTFCDTFFKKIFIYLFWLLQVLVVACGLPSCGMHAGSSFPTRDWTCVPCNGSVESYPLDHQGSPLWYILKSVFVYGAWYGTKFIVLHVEVITVEKVILFLLNCFDTFVENQLTIRVQDYIWILCSFSLIYVFLYTSFPHLFFSFKKKIFIKVYSWLGLSWWRSGWESTCQCREHGFDPWSGKIPHAAEQISPCTATTEPVL